MTAAQRLRDLLKPTTPEYRATLERDGIPHRAIRRASLGQQVCAATHLRLCALIGRDPVTWQAAPFERIGELFWPSLGAALRIKRIQDNLSLRQAAKRAGMSYSSLMRIEHAEAVSIDAVLLACAWLGRHPHEFVSPCVSYENKPARAA